MKNITVFCGSSTGDQNIYEETAYKVGTYLAQQEIGIVFGGGKIGMMGAVADGAISQNGTVIGVIPSFLSTKEIAHDGITEMIVVETMHQRKTIMHDRCDGLLTLPGGFGTMEELFEVLTWGQLGLHRKPMAILNTNGYYDPLINLVDKMVTDGFLKKINADMILVDTEIEPLIDKMKSYVAPEVGKWITRATT